MVRSAQVQDTSPNQRMAPSGASHLARLPRTRSWYGELGLNALALHSRGMYQDLLPPSKPAGWFDLPLPWNWQKAKGSQLTKPTKLEFAV